NASVRSRGSVTAYESRSWRWASRLPPAAARPRITRSWARSGSSRKSARLASGYMRSVEFRACRADLDAARQGARRHLQQVEDGGGDVGRVDLPGVGLRDLAVGEAGGYRARHDGAHAHAVIAQVEHHR